MNYGNVMEKDSSVTLTFKINMILIAQMYSQKLEKIMNLMKQTKINM